MTVGGRFWRDRRAVAAVEMALISPFLVTLFLATFEVTQLIRVKTKVALAAQAIQNMVAGQKSATTLSLATMYSGGQLVMTPFSGSNLTAAIASVGFNSSGSAASVNWQVLEGGATSMTTAAACSLASQLSLGGDSVIVVQATYAYTPVLSYLLGKTYVLTQVAYGRPRNVGAVSALAISTGSTGSC